MKLNNIVSFQVVYLMLGMTTNEIIFFIEKMEKKFCVEIKQDGRVILFREGFLMDG